MKAIISCVLLLTLVIVPILSIGCSSSAPTKEQCEQAITDYIKSNISLSQYRGFHDIMVTEVGESGTLGEPPNEFPGWPVKATIYRSNRPALDDKVFLVAKDSFGDWYVPSLYQSILDFGNGP